MSIEVATEEPGALSPVADAVTTALAQITTTNATITEHLTKARELGETYKGVAFAVRTVKGMDEATKARAAIREHRYAIQKLKDDGSKMLGTMQRQFNIRATEIVTEITSLETPIHEQITAEETRKELEKQERQEAEDRRLTAHLDALSAINRHIADAADEDEYGITARMDMVAQLVIDATWEEFETQAKAMQSEVLVRLGDIRAKVMADAQAKAALAAAQEQLATQQRELQEQQERMRQQQADLDRRQGEMDAKREQQERAQRERAAAVAHRVEELRILATGKPGMGELSSAALHGELTRLRTMPILRDQYDDRMEEAQQHCRVAIGNLTELLEAAIAREAKERADREAAAVQMHINDIVALGALAEKSGRALKDLREELDVLLEVDCTDKMFGNRSEEAATAVADAVAKVRAAIELALVREQAAAQLEAERAAREITERTERLRNERIVSSALAMHDAAKALLAFMDDTNVHVIDAKAGDLNRLMDDVRNIIRSTEA